MERSTWAQKSIERRGTQQRSPTFDDVEQLTRCGTLRSVWSTALGVEYCASERQTDPMIIDVQSEDETRAVARAVARSMRPGDVLVLSGPLAAGKTLFVEAMARALGVPDDVPVSSPTFALVHEYPEATPPLVHADVYRLRDAAELLELGLDEPQCGLGSATSPQIEPILVVEWGERFLEYFPDSRSVALSFLPDADSTATRRYIELKGFDAGQFKGQVDGFHITSADRIG